MASFPDSQVRPGELIVLDGPDAYGDPRVSLMTLDPFHNELASVFGTIDQLADVPFPSRFALDRGNWPHGSCLVWYEVRMDVHPDDLYGPLVNYGPGWQVRRAFPYDISENSVEEFYDVDSVSLPEKIEGDSFVYSVANSRYESAPGFGDPSKNIDPSADLDDLVDIVYIEPVEENSLIKWDQVAGEWKNVYLEPFLSTRSDVNFNNINPEDQQALVYGAFEEKWQAQDISTEGAVVIPDGRRSRNKELEYLVLPGTHESLNGKILDFGLGVTSEPTPSQPHGHDYVLNAASEIRAEGVTSEFWERFPKGSFYFEAPPGLDYGFLPYYERTGLARERYDHKEVQGLSKESRFQDISVSSNITPIPGLLNPSGQYYGDYTIQFWFRMATDAVEGIDDRTLFSLYAYGLGGGGDELSVVITKKGGERYINSPPHAMSLVVRYPRSGVFPWITERDLLFNIYPDIDYHVAVQWDAEAQRLKTWVDGSLRLAFETPDLDSFKYIDLESLFIGRNMRGYIADFNITLTTEYNKDYVERLAYSKDFNPPGHWGRKLVEGPKASLKTLGLTRTGLFSWISQEQPYAWTTAFGRNQFDTVSQSLDINYGSLLSGNILSWNAAEGKLSSTKSILAGDDSVSKNPGDLAGTAFNSVIDAAYYKIGQGTQTGNIKPMDYHRKGDFPYNDAGSNYFWGGELIFKAPVNLAGLPSVVSLPSGKAWQIPHDRKYSDLFENQTSSYLSLNRERDTEIEDWRQGLPSEQNSLLSWGFRFKLNEAISDYGSTTIAQGGDVSLRVEGGFFTIDVSLRISSGYFPDGFTLTNEWIYENGFFENATITLPGENVVADRDYEISILADSIEGKFSVYLNGRRQYIIVQAPVPSPGSTLTPVEVFSQESNAGLPQYLAIGNYSRDIDHALSPTLFSGGTACLYGAFFSFDRREDFKHQRYYDFSAFYDARISQPGVSLFTGARSQSPGFSDYFSLNYLFDNIADQFLQSSSELTRKNERLCQLDGEWIGSSQNLYKRNSPYFSTRTSESAFLYQSKDSNFGASGSFRTFSSDYYIAQGVNNYNAFQDVLAYDIRLADGEVLVYNSGYWTNSLIDDFSPIRVSDKEPMGVLQDGDTLYWSVARNGYINDQPRSYIQYGLKDITNVEIAGRLKSNDMLIYNYPERKFESKPVDYFSRINSLLDVSLTEGIDEGDVLSWNSKSNSFSPEDPDPQIITPHSLLDVDLLAEPRSPGSHLNHYNYPTSDVIILVWDGRKQLWVKGETYGYSYSGSYTNRIVEGEYQTHGLRDFYIRRHANRMLGISERWYKGPWDAQKGAWYDESGDIPIDYVNSAQPCSNSQRGDGGDFNYAETSTGMALGILGGGDFENGVEDPPVEMIIGQDGGEFVEAIEPVGLPPRNNDPVFSNTAYILDFEGDHPFKNKSLRGSITPGGIRGNATLVSSGGAFDGRHVKITDWVSSEEYEEDDSCVFFYPEGYFDVTEYNWSISFYFKTEETAENRNEYLFSQGDLYISQSQIPKPTHLILEHRFLENGDTSSSLKFRWHDSRNEDYYSSPWEFEMQISDNTINYGEWEHFVIAYDAEASLLSAFYAGSRISHLDLNSLEGMISDGMGEGIWSGMYVNTHYQQGFCLGGRNAVNATFAGIGPLIGAVDDFKLTTLSCEYDPALESIPVPGSLVLEEFPPTFDYETLLPLNPRIVSILGFTGMPEAYPYADSLWDVTYDSVGFVWGDHSSFIDVAEGDTRLEPVRLPVFTRPEAPLWRDVSVNYEADPKIASMTTASMIHGLATINNQSDYQLSIETERMGGQGLLTRLTDDLAMNYEDFTFEAIYTRNPPRETATIRYTPIETFNIKKGMALVVVAAEEDLSDPTAGDSWGIRLLTSVEKRSELVAHEVYPEGVRFEWWTQDNEYHHLDFLYGPDALDGTPKDRPYDFSVNENQEPGEDMYVEDTSYNPLRLQPGNYNHTVIQRSLRKSSITVFHNNSRKELFHPRLAEPFRDISALPDPRIGIGIDPRVTFESTNDFSGRIAATRMTRGICLYGSEARFPDKHFSL